MIRPFVPAFIIAAIGAVGLQAQVPGRIATCRHDENEGAADRARREQALSLAREINRAQGRIAERTRKYARLSELRDLPAAPEGFQVHLLTDGDAYSLSIKDARDVCHYAVFSDQAGLLYEGSPKPPQIARQSRSRSWLMDVAIH
jgi:hypothetical protein